MNLEDLKADAVGIFEAGLRQADPYACVRRSFVLEGRMLKAGDFVYDIGSFERIIVIGAGKAAAPMGRAVEDVLGERISAGLLITKYGHSERLRHIRIVEARHPLPDESGVLATEEILRLISGLNDKTLVICLISGGGSSLLVSPAEGIALEHKIETTKRLLGSGATIKEINSVRKHLSKVKGGRLAALAAPARTITLVLSDVIGDCLDVIASGPTAPDDSTYMDALSVLGKYRLLDKVPKPVIDRLRDGAQARIEETPKQGDPIFLYVRNEIIGSLGLALDAAEKEAMVRGYRAFILSSCITGEASEVGKVFGAIAAEIRKNSRPLLPPACIIAGGETTVTIRGDGKGGRNQEMALSAAIDMAGLSEVVFLSAGTDGTDGPTDAAGAFAYGTTVGRAEALGLDARECLSRNDSYSFFKSIGDLFFTGPTKTNVMDIHILLVRP